MKCLRAHGQGASLRSSWSVVLLVASAALVSINACASNEELGSIIPSDGGTTPDTTAPHAPDADVGPEDAGVDSDVDAAPRTCTDQGFCHVPLPEAVKLNGVWGDGAGVVWAVAEDGKILRWDGNVWAIHASVKGPLFSIWGSGPADIWIGGEAGLFHGTGPSSGQLTFTAVPSDSDMPITSVHGFGPNDVWAVGGRITWDPETWEGKEESRVLHYTGPTGDPATEWRLDPISERPAVFSRVWGSNADDVWLGGSTDLAEPYGGLVLRGKSDGDGGTAFTEFPVGTGYFDSIQRPTGGVVLDEAIIVGESRGRVGYIWIGPTDPSDGGDAGPRIFTGDDLGFGYMINAVWASSKNDAWIAGNGGRVWHWDGTSWSVGGVTLTKFPLVNDLQAMWGSPNGDLWIVGDGIALRKNLGGGK